ncbi:hypothetical protein Tco_1384409 [Tanacetum coccineum]
MLSKPNNEPNSGKFCSEELGVVAGVRIGGCYNRMKRGFGVGGRLVCEKKDGSAMVVTGISIREVAFSMLSKILHQTPDLDLDSACWRRSQMIQTSSVVDHQDLPELGSHECLQFPGLLEPGAI